MCGSLLASITTAQKYTLVKEDDIVGYTEIVLVGWNLYPNHTELDEFLFQTASSDLECVNRTLPKQVFCDSFVSRFSEISQTVHNLLTLVKGPPTDVSLKPNFKQFILNPPHIFGRHLTQHDPSLYSLSPNDTSQFPDFNGALLHKTNEAISLISSYLETTTNLLSCSNQFRPLFFRNIDKLEQQVQQALQNEFSIRLTLREVMRKEGKCYATSDNVVYGIELPVSKNNEVFEIFKISPPFEARNEYLALSYPENYKLSSSDGSLIKIFPVVCKEGLCEIKSHSGEFKNCKLDTFFSPNVLSITCASSHEDMSYSFLGKIPYDQLGYGILFVAGIVVATVSTMVYQKYCKTESAVSEARQVSGKDNNELEPREM